MAISKERLEQLAEQKTTVYHLDEYKSCRSIDFNCWRIVDFDKFGRVGLEYADGMWSAKLDDLYETLDEIEFIKKYHDKRMEYFCPPMELKDGKEYNFTVPFGKYDGYGAIYRLPTSGKFVVRIYSSRLYTTFDTYPEAVAYARKLFKGGVK